MQKDDLNNTFSFSIDNHNDIITSMGQKINDLSFSLSSISSKNQQLQKQLTLSQIHNKQTHQYCTNNHPMRYLQTDSTNLSNCCICDRCNQKVDYQSNVFWHCGKCDFDLCAKCGGYKKTICPFGHKLQYVSQYSQFSYFQCDICLTDKIKSGWHCDCDFDLCQNCFDSQENSY